VYALALCTRQQTSENLRVAAYNAVKTVCKAPKDFLLFVKFAYNLSHDGSGKSDLTFSCWVTSGEQYPLYRLIFAVFLNIKIKAYQIDIELIDVVACRAITMQQPRDGPGYFWATTW
jgi:hypothetical protein